MKNLTTNIVVPIATPDDARETARVLSEYDFGRITAVHVIEHVNGAPDPVSPEQAEIRAQKAIAAFREILPEADAERVFREDVVEGILDVGSEQEASAIVFRPRGGNRLVQFLSGDVALRLITTADRPIIAVPDGEER